MCGGSGDENERSYVPLPKVTLRLRTDWPQPWRRVTGQKALQGKMHFRAKHPSPPLSCVTGTQTSRWSNTLTSRK